MPDAKTAATAKEIFDVACRCEQSFHLVTALHDLCNEAICGPTDDPITMLVLLRESLRGLARDMEIWAEVLDNNRGGLGYFVAHYGSV